MTAPPDALPPTPSPAGDHKGTLTASDLGPAVDLSSRQVRQRGGQQHQVALSPLGHSPGEGEHLLTGEAGAEDTEQWDRWDRESV